VTLCPAASVIVLGQAAVSVCAGVGEAVEVEVTVGDEVTVEVGVGVKLTVGVGVVSSLLSEALLVNKATADIPATATMTTITAATILFTPTLKILQRDRFFLLFG
jgi:hypothetical protein